MKIVNDGTKPLIAAAPGYMDATAIPPGGELSVPDAATDAGVDVRTQAEAGSSFPSEAGNAAG